MDCVRHKLSLFGIAAQVVGYARDRVSTGKAIIEHQAVGFRLAKIYCDVAVCQIYEGTSDIRR